MKTRALVLALALFVVGAAVCFAQNMQMGTWKLNEAKSKFSPGAPKNNTVVYEAVGQNVKVTIDGVGIDGQPVHTEWTGKFDSKDYPVVGDPNSNARSYTTIDDLTLGFNIRKGRKIMLRSHRRFCRRQEPDGHNGRNRCQRQESEQHGGIRQAIKENPCSSQPAW
jgi:hypothetical protein